MTALWTWLNRLLARRSLYFGAIEQIHQPDDFGFRRATASRQPKQAEE